MPELPEVEVIAQGLDRVLPGETVRSVELLWAGSVATPDPESFARRLVGRRFARAGRRGKFVVLDLDDGQHLLAHLRMSGTLCVAPNAEERSPYARAILHLAGDCDLRFTDTRKFGRLYLVDDPAEITGDLGPEPLAREFTPERFTEMIHRRHARIKPLLLDQRFIAGLGNIYVDEALFRAGIHPLRRSDWLSDAESRRLYTAIQDVLREAIAHQGTTFSTYRNANGEPGSNQGFLRVYGRKGEACTVCGEPIERIVVGQRGTHLCPRCQPAGES